MRVWRQMWAAVQFVDRFTRLHLLFFTSLWALLGAVSVRTHFAISELATLLAVVVCFHVYAYVLNDVIDLPIDRTQAARHHDPLVKGDLSRAQALSIALAQPLIAMALTGTLGGGGAAYVFLATAFASLGAYNLWGKRCPVPPLTDAVQGIGWGSLSAFAACALGEAPNVATWIVVSYAIVFTMFINGIHGSFRDLSNDMARGARTTAIWLGARPASAGQVVTSRRLTIYAWTVLAALVAVNGLFLIRNDFRYGRLAWAVAAIGVMAINAAGLCLQPLVLRPRGASADIAWRLQMYIMALSLPFAFVPQANIIVTVVFLSLNLGALALWDCTLEVARWILATGPGPISDAAPLAKQATGTD